jgi:glutathione peroxidase
MLGVALSAYAGPAAGSAFDFSFTRIDGEPLPLSQFRGQPVLIVNTASFCGFTGQYAQLQSIWQRYRDRGLVVLAVPSNDFGGQEPGDEAAIQDFCETTFDIDFPITTKEHVVGMEAHPFFRWAASQVGALGKPRWNFHKYLIAADGRVADWFSTVTPATADRVLRAIEEHLVR